MIIYRKLVEECALRFLLRSQHGQSPFILKQIESVKGLQIKKSFSTELAQRVGRCGNNHGSEPQEAVIKRGNCYADIQAKNPM